MSEQEKTPQPSVVVIVGDEGTRAEVTYPSGEISLFFLNAEFYPQYAARAFRDHVRRLVEGTCADDHCKIVEALGRGPESRKGREGAGTGGKPSILEAAVMELTGKSRAEVAAQLGALTAVKKRALVRDDRLAPIYARIKAEREKEPKTVHVEELDSLLG